MEFGLLFSLDPSIIIDFMNSIFDQVYSLVEHPTLQNWGNDVIVDMAERTENQVTNQLGYNPLD